METRRDPCPTSRPGTTPGQAGFSLVELVISIAIGLIIAAMGMPALQNFIQRSATEGTARNCATLLQLAKLEAIKTGFPAVVRIDPAARKLQAHINIDDPGTQYAYDVDATKTYQTTDYIFREMVLPTGVEFEGPLGVAEAIDGGTADPGGGDNLLVFKPDGSIEDIGAIRLGDTRENFVEIRVEPQGTARIELRKWDDNATAWFAAGEEGQTWEWN